MTENLITINRGFLSFRLLLILLSLIYLNVCWYLYQNFSDEQKETTIAKLFLSYCIIITLSYTKDIYKVYLMIKLYGKTTSQQVWNLLQLGSVFGILNPYHFIKQGENIVCIWMFYNGGNLNNFNSSNLMQNVSLYIKYYGIVLQTGYILLILLLTITSIIFRTNMCAFDRNEYLRSNEIRSAILNNSDSFRAITTASIGDSICAICLESHENNNNNNNNNNNDIEEQQEERQWTALDCGHKYHIECIKEWFKYNAQCPYCRRHHIYDAIP